MGKQNPKVITVTTFNQTNVELKCNKKKKSDKLLDSFNQTNVELKYEKGYVNLQVLKTFNQTNVELKCRSNT